MSEATGTKPFVYSTNGEDYESEGFASREEALSAARAAAEEELGLIPGDGYIVNTGVWAPPPVGEWIEGHTSTVFLENLGDEALEAADEHAASWLTEVTPGQKRELGAAFTDAFNAWMEKHGHQPTFFIVEDVIEHSCIAASPEPLCPGGCGAPAHPDGELCRECLLGALHLSRNTIKRLKAQQRPKAKGETEASGDEADGGDR